MVLKGVSDSYTGIVATTQPGLLAFWGAMLAFSIALLVYRRKATHYGAMAMFCGLSLLARLVPFLLPTIGLQAFPVVLLAFAASRVAMGFVIEGLCEKNISKIWRSATIAVGGIVTLAAILSIVLGESSYISIELGVMTLLALHALLATPLIARTKKAPAMTWLLGGAVPWAFIWVAAAFVGLSKLFGLGLVQGAREYDAPAIAAADGLMGVALFLATMFELSSTEPSAAHLDEFNTMVGTSIKRFIPTEFLQHLEKKDFFELKLGDHVKKEMTIFFSDIRAFTEMSERLTPEESFAFINSYLSRVVPIINQRGGFVDKYMGDGIMALFEENGGADQAVESAVEMQGKMIEYNGHRAKVNYKPISMGIGIHTGTLMLGVVGVPDRMEGTVISDAVNLSSRLQSIAKAFNIPLVISERTFMQLDDPGRYKYRFIGKVRVKGKDAPVSVFEIFDGLPEEQFERKMKSNTFFEQGMMAYYQKDYSQGVFYFKRALETVPDDGASRFYLETCLRKAMSVKALEK